MNKIIQDGSCAATLNISVNLTSFNIKAKIVNIYIAKSNESNAKNITLVFVFRMD